MFVHRRVLHAGVAALALSLPGLPRAPLASAQTPPAIDISVSDAAVTEGKDAEFTVAVTNNPGIFVNFATTQGTAIDGVDFTGRTGQAFVPFGSTSSKFTVHTLQDNLFEPDKQFTVQLSSPTTGTITRGIGTATIRSDDPQPTITVNDTTVAEGDTGFVNAVFDVTLSNPSYQPIWLDYVTAPGGSATGGPTPTGDVDYRNTTGQLRWLPGNNFPQQILVPVRGDVVHEGDEDFQVQLTPHNALLSTPTSAPAVTATITDDDPVPTISVGDTAVLEGNAGARIVNVTASLSNPTTSNVTAQFTTANGSARSFLDYVPVVGGTLTIPAGATSAVIPLQVIGDLVTEPNEAFSVVILSAANATLGDQVANITITNDDP
jgi:hypothetical protein